MDKFQKSSEDLAIKHTPYALARKALMVLFLLPIGPAGAVCCATQVKQLNHDVAADGGVQDGPKDAPMQDPTSWYFKATDINHRDQLVIEYFTEHLKDLMHVDDLKLDQPYHKPFTFQGVDFIFSFTFHVENQTLEIQMGLDGPPCDSPLHLRNVVRMPIKQQHDRIKSILLESEDIPDTKI